MSQQSASKQLQRSQSSSSMNSSTINRTSNIFNSNWQERQTNFKVVVRVRPPIQREILSQFENTIFVDKKERQIIVSENLNEILDDNNQLISNAGAFSFHTFFFDYVYDPRSTQREVYETTARNVVDSSLQGFNATLVAYGQTGTGKTYTMEGFNTENGDNNGIESRGIIPRSIEQVFSHIQKHANNRMRFLVRASYLQIYNEMISDLLKPERSNLSIREDKKRGVYVDGLSEWVVRSPAEIYNLMERGASIRTTGETKMNEMSSRSHAVFIIIVEQSETVYVDDNGFEMSPDDFQQFIQDKAKNSSSSSSSGSKSNQQYPHFQQDIIHAKLENHIKQTFKIGKLNLVDLAGSERVRLSGATGIRLEESKQINKSLAALGNVISALTDTKTRTHIPYRDSKLTRLLEDSLGGNCKTTMMAMISPALESIGETISTLKFANRAKNIRNEAKVNEDLDQKSLLRKYERELKQLRAELQEKNRNVVDKRRLLEIDELRKRAEADKMAAIKALEIRSLEFLKEKEEKKKLEERITMLTSQMIHGHTPRQESNSSSSYNNTGGEEVQEVNQLLNAHHERVRHEYESKLASIEKERETIQEEKAQVDRYKQLLLKQRDIMIALTQRLVERDEQIMALQDELDAYDNHQKDLTERLDEKTAALIKFQRICLEVNATSPTKNTELMRALDEWSQEQQQQYLQQTDSNGNILNTNNNNNMDMYNNEYNYNNNNSNSNSKNNNNNSSSSSSSGGYGNINNNNTATEVNYDDDEDDDDDENESTSAASPITRHHQPQPPSRPAEFKSTTSSSTATTTTTTTTTNDDGDDDKVTTITKEAVLLAQAQFQFQLDEQLQRSAEAEATAAAATQELSIIQSRNELLTKEREAVQIIMEQKINILVQSVSRSVQLVINNIPEKGGAVGMALSKDIAALERLINASIIALKNSSSSSSFSSSSSSFVNRGNQQPQVQQQSK